MAQGSLSDVSETSRNCEADGSQLAMRFRGPCISMFAAVSWARIGAAWHGVCSKRSLAAEGMRGQAQFGFWGTALGRMRLQGRRSGLHDKTASQPAKKRAGKPCVGPAALLSCSCARLYLPGRAAAAVHAPT